MRFTSLDLPDVLAAQTAAARLLDMSHMTLRIVENGRKRGVCVDWARCGRQGMTLWDETGAWTRMPERVEKEVYGGLTLAERRQIEQSQPRSFDGPEDATA